MLHVSDRRDDGQRKFGPYSRKGIVRSTVSRQRKTEWKQNDDRSGGENLCSLSLGSLNVFTPRRCPCDLERLFTHSLSEDVYPLFNESPLFK
jgi:hypothetical protein